MKLRYNLTVLLSVLVLLIACPRQVMAQTGEITVSGKILDENGEPVVGAFVFIPGTTKGATADLDGLIPLRCHPMLHWNSVVWATGNLQRKFQAATSLTLS